MDRYVFYLESLFLIYYSGDFCNFATYNLYRSTMAEELVIDKEAGKAEKYQELIPQLEALVKNEKDVIANMANISAALWQTFHFFWVGFYRVVDEELVLGPFQGPIACMRIRRGRGVCGSAWKEGKTLVVPDVDQFPGHIACDSASRSEIVVPVRNQVGEITAVLDIDSDQLDSFDKTDVLYLERVVSFLFN